MNVALIFPNNLYTSPYLPYYTQILEKAGTTYDIISWNRNNREEKGTLAFSLHNKGASNFLRIFDYFKFAKFVIRTIEKNNYDKLIVFSCQLGIYLKQYLGKNYKDKYILDIRDYSPIVPYFGNRMKNLIHNASAVSLSSEGFKTWLPEYDNYMLSHNVNKNLVNAALNSNSREKPFFQNKTIQLDTIGQIKDFDSDSKVVSTLGNNPKYSLKFMGFGSTLANLKAFVQENGLNNVVLTGPYKKEEESELLSNTDFINILISNNTFNNQVLSNRLYLSALLNIPCLVNDYSIEQRKIIEEYQFGIVIKEYSTIPQEIEDYIQNFESSTFTARCQAFLKKVLNDYLFFEKTLTEFINTPNHVRR
ncbi:hypothetical protein M3P19_16125 [Muricauda sp. 2012CJ35-5]|uniref:Glycosyltransferase n=1 Tax=Flagellimonas spongiicola TaxID=2942208 RepID=A0ABT0PVY1_9FLAO|nr:hypothetical protein [Allomuricauda spongiicola]MCL6275543.1 hypothetical protein [Allomuricauda spongiicola]